MKTDTKNDITMLGVLIGIALLIVLIFTTAYAHADTETLMIVGSNSEMDLFVAIDGTFDIIRVETDSSYYEITDTEIKNYKSGAFRMSGDTGLLFAHPVGNMKYDIVFLTADGVQRLTAFQVILKDAQYIQKNGAIPSQTIEPKSSIGADITRHDIPTDTSRDHVREPKIIVTIDNITHIFINNEYAPNITVINQDFQRISADVNIKIERDDQILKEISSTLPTHGSWSPVINIQDYRYNPGFCYNVIVTATLGNLTSTVTDDFIVVTIAKYWDNNDSTIDSDSHCND